MPRSQASQTPLAAAGSSAAELSLRVFCESALALLPTQPDENSVLREILPSCFRVMRDCAHRVGLLKNELHEWEARSEQLIRLARLHGADVAEQLAPSVERTRALSMRAIDALDGLRRADLSEPSEDDSSETESREPPPVRAEFHLSAFCEAVLELSAAEPGRPSLLSQATPSLVQIFRCCEPAALEEMRAELRHAERQGETLVQLAAAHSDAAARELRKRTAHTWNRAASLLDALESLLLVAAGPAAEESAAPRQVVVDSAETPNDGPPSAPHGRADAADAIFRLAMRCQKRGDLAEAARLYGGVLQLDPQHRLAYCQRGRVRLLSGDPKGAIADLSEAIRTNRRDASAFRWRGDAHAINGDFAQAAADYAQSLRLAPDAPVVRYNRAVVLRQAGALDEAWQELERLLPVLPRSAPVHLNRGLIHLARGERDQAIAEFQQALKYQPDSREAREHLQRLTSPSVSDEHKAAIPETEFEPMNLGASVADIPAPADRSSSTSTPAEAAETEDLDTFVLDDFDDDSLPLLDDETGKPGETRRESEGAPVASTPLTSSNRTDGPAERSENFDDQSVLAILSVQESPSDDTLVGYSESDTRVDLLSETAVSAKPSTGARRADSNDFGELEIDLSPPRFGETSAAPPSFNVGDLPVAPVAAEFSASVVAAPPIEEPNHQIKVVCPACGVESSVGWERLQKGKVLSCPRCSQCFTMQANGDLARVSKSADGKWAIEHEQPPRLFTLRNVAAGVLLLLVGVGTLWLGPVLFAKPGPREIILPDELERRAAVFGEAWLNRDYAVIDRLTVPEQKGTLFSWHRRHPAPETARGVKVEVDIVSEKAPLGEVTLKFTSQQPLPAPLPAISQQWREHRGEWLFSPAGGSPRTSSPSMRKRSGAMSSQAPYVQSVAGPGGPARRTSGVSSRGPQTSESR